MSSSLFMLLFALPTSQPVDEEAYNQILEGMEKSRRLLVTGEYSAVGHQVEQRPSYTTAGEIQIQASFDFEQDIGRFDKTEPVRVGKLSPAASAWLKQQPREAFGKEIHWPAELRPSPVVESQTKRIAIGLDKCIYATSDQVIIYPRTKIETLRRELGALDVRALGLQTWGMFSRGDGFDVAMQFLRSTPPVSVEAGDNGVVVVTWHVHNNVWKRVLSIDRRNGLTPIRSLVFRRNSNKKTDVVTWRDKPEEVQTTSWSQRDGIYVPVTLSFSLDMSEVEGREIVNTCDLGITWKSVNRPVPSDLVELEKFKEVDFAKVNMYDARVQPAALLKRPAPSPPTAPVFSLSRALIVINCLLIVGLAAAVVYRTRLARSKTRKQH